MGADSWDDLDMMFASDAAHGAALETSSLSGMAQQASVADTQPLQRERPSRRFMIMSSCLSTVQ